MSSVDSTPGERLARRKSGIAFAIPAWASSVSIAVVDQFLVSGMNFVTIVTVGRVCGAAALGTYSLSATLILLLAAAAEALITGPYAINLPRMISRRTEYGGSLMIHSCMLGGAVTVLLLILSEVALLCHVQIAAAQAIWPVALVALPVTVREVARRHAFAHTRASAALVLDIYVSSALLISLLSCAFAKVLSSSTAVLLIGASSVVGCVFYLFFGGNHFRFERKAVFSDLKMNFGLGRWLLASQATMIAQFSIAQWVITLLEGPVQNGILMAASSVAMVANPALTGLSNLVLPKAARAVQAGGDQALRQFLSRVAVTMAGASLCYCVFIASLGHTLVTSVYGPKYLVPTSALIWLALTFAFRCIAMPVYIGLWVQLQAKVNVYINVIGMFTILLFIVALRPFAVAGVACSMMLGESITCLIRWYLFFRPLKKSAKDDNPLGECHG